MIRKSNKSALQTVKNGISLRYSLLLTTADLGVKNDVSMALGEISHGTFPTD